ncbi:dUTP diphosphatase [Yimella sp. cx-573]|nr:dUTP diphosphatase [Yimella sp. cx-573]
MSTVQIRIKQLDPELPLPAYARPGDAGMDLLAARSVTLQPGQRQLVPTGIAVAVPEGHVALVHPRSGLAHKHGISIVNAPGTIDSGYRGEILVNLINLDPQQEFRIERGDRIAQLIVQEFRAIEWDRVDELPDSVRGATGHGASGGFGATLTDDTSKNED